MKLYYNKENQLLDTYRINKKGEKEGVMNNNTQFVIIIDDDGVEMVYKDKRKGLSSEARVELRSLLDNEIQLVKNTGKSDRLDELHCFLEELNENN